MLFINNAIAEELLSMSDALAAMEESYKQLVTTEAVCRPRIDMRIPTGERRQFFQWGTMEGGSTSGYFAIRMKSDIYQEEEYNGAVTVDYYCTKPGLFCGFILLVNVKNGEPLAIVNDGFVQHLRVGADGGIGTKYMARENAQVVGMLGSGGMARAHMEAFTRVRPIKRLQVFSPTKEHRTRFGAEMADKFGIDVKVCDRPEDVYEGADILAALTDSAVPVINAKLVEEGTHIVNISANGSFLDEEMANRVDIYLRFGVAPAPVDHPEFAISGPFITYAARPDIIDSFNFKQPSKRGHDNISLDKVVYFSDIVNGKYRKRVSGKEITFSERGNLQGAQFFPLAGKLYELARNKGIGHEVPTEWLLQDIRN